MNRLPIIEKTNDSKRKIKQLYDSDSVLFEETLLVSNNIKYSICFVPKAEVYDVIIEDFENNFTKYQVFHKLSPSTLSTSIYLKVKVIWMISAMNLSVSVIRLSID